MDSRLIFTTTFERLIIWGILRPRFFINFELKKGEGKGNFNYYFKFKNYCRQNVIFSNDGRLCTSKRISVLKRKSKYSGKFLKEKTVGLR